ncbi:MAG: glycoside hydrolase family 65 protein [Betaproteobacteria bacterium]|nr:glycoside hydrolase family 65 protein [Betaproteobacteria bacterium]
MIHHERVVPPSHVYPADEWNIVEKQYSPEFLEMTETIFAMGNGYFGMRGCPEEGTPVCNNGTYVNGFYDTWPIVYGEDAFGFARTGQTIVNVTDTKTIKLYVDDEPFYLPRANLVSFDRRLNFKAGTLDREIVWETPAGKQVLIRSRRLVSFQHRHLAAIHYYVEMLNGEAPIVLSCEMATPAPPADETSGDPRKSKGIRGRVLRPLTHYHRDQRVVLCHGTERSGMTLACATDHVIETECAHSVQVRSAENSGEVVFSVIACPGQPVTLVKYMAYHTSATAPAHEMCGRVERTLDRAVEQGFKALQEGQQQYMDDFWHRSGVRVSDVRHELVKRTSVEIQQAIRFNLFHILQACARSDNTGVPAKGLTGDAYEGHYFWDSEIYLLPFLIYTAPRIAKNLLLFRYNMLDHARTRARELNHRGAMFPWRTISGEEASAYYAAGTAQYHINADIAYALRKYVNATGDQEFLERQGAEMLIETARMWVDLGFFSERKGGKFCINGVTGPDEYNAIVDNNTFTNLMARENLRYAAQTVDALRQTKPEVYTHLAHETALEAGEVEEWTRAADNMFIPYDEASGIYPQDDGFMDKERLDLNSIPPDHFPLLLFYHPLVIYRHQVIKQADIILAMFLLRNEFTLEAKRRNFQYYDPLTTGDSSLSSCIQAIIANEIGQGGKSIAYARASLLMDLADVGGNVKDGCHIAAMGGTWMIFAYGFTGMQDNDGILTFRPRRVPEETARMQLRLTYRGQLFEVEISTQEAKYTLIEGNDLVLQHEDEAFHLTPETPVVVRPVKPREIKATLAAPHAGPR